MFRTVLSLIAFLALACQGAYANPAAQSALDVDQPEGWKDDLALAKPEDINPDPDILEFELKASITEMEIVPGKTTPVWAYNGSLPGPLIRAEVGDRVIVHFTNDLPEATSIHWHGLRVTNEMDGVPNVTQDPIPPGGTFTYDFVLRDAGTYWYHPHANTAAQVGWGLYGPIVVEDPADPEVFGEDVVIMFSDMSLDEEGNFIPVDSGGSFGDLFGREGQVMLVNGKVMPTLKVRKGKQQRWRVINAARSRYLNLRYRRTDMVHIGGDSGLAERSVVKNEILVTPSERADVVFTPQDEPGSENVLKWYPFDRGYGTTTNRLPKSLMKIVTVNEPAVTPEEIPEHLRDDIEPIDTTGAKELTLDLTIDFDSDGQVVMGINGVPFHKVKPIEASIGETHVWTVTNDTDFDHPFHLHGYFFQVLDESRPLEWKDTVNVPVGGEVKLAVKFDERPGGWMYHCHILDHAEAGMMGLLNVDP